MAASSHTRGLLLNLLATARGPMPVAALIEAGRVFDVTGNNVRVTLRRLCERGLVSRVGGGLYTLAEPAARLNRRVRAWSRPPRVSRWDGRWLALVATGRGRSARGARALGLFGFAEARPGLAVRPANLRPGADEILEDLRDLGLDPAAELLVARPAEASLERTWRGLWDGAALARAHDETAARIEASLPRLPRMPRNAALRESFELGGAGIRQLVYDPLLPDAIAPTAPRERLRAVMQRYDRAGRALWSDFMQGFGIEPASDGLRATPFGSGLTEAPLASEDEP